MLSEIGLDVLGLILSITANFLTFFIGWIVIEWGYRVWKRNTNYRIEIKIVKRKNKVIKCQKK